MLHHQLIYHVRAVAGHAARLEKTATDLHGGKTLPEAEVATMAIDSQRIAEHSAALAAHFTE